MRDCTDFTTFRTQRLGLDRPVTDDQFDRAKVLGRAGWNNHPTARTSFESRIRSRQTNERGERESVSHYRTVSL